MNESEPSKLTITSILFVIALFGIFSLIYPTYVFIDLLRAVSRAPSVITMDKGVFYLFGVGVMLLALIPDGVYHKILGNEISSQVQKWVSRTAISGLIIMVLLPHLIHYPMENVLQNNNYVECKKQSKQWLLFRTIVYTQPGYC